MRYLQEYGMRHQLHSHTLPLIMSSQYPVERYTRANRDEVLTFLQRVYSPTTSQLLTAHWDWNYDSNPMNREDEPYILLMRDGKTLIGMIGAIPLRVSIQGKEFPLTHSCDLGVDRAYRGRRLSERLLEHYMNANSLSFGWVNSISHRRVRNLQRTTSFQLTPLVKVLNHRVLVLGLLQSRSRSLFNRLLLSRPVANQSIAPCPSPQVQIKQMYEFNERFDDFWQRVRDEYSVILVRDRQCLNWRYVSRPDAKYILFSAAHGPRLVGYLVARLVESKPI